MRSFITALFPQETLTQKVTNRNGVSAFSDIYTQIPGQKKGQSDKIFRSGIFWRKEQAEFS